MFFKEKYTNEILHIFREYIYLPVILRVKLEYTTSYNLLDYNPQRAVQSQQLINKYDEYRLYKQLIKINKCNSLYYSIYSI